MPNTTLTVFPFRELGKLAPVIVMVYPPKKFKQLGVILTMSIPGGCALPVMKSPSGHLSVTLFDPAIGVPWRVQVVYPLYYGLFTVKVLHYYSP